MELDYLLGSSRPQAPLIDRVEWLVEIFRWMRVPGSLTVQGMNYESGQIQATRVRYLLLILEKNPEWKRVVAQTLRSILRDSNALDLFCVTGLPSESGFISEVFDRLMEKILPRPPHEKDLSAVFSLLFSSEHDIKWLERLDENVLSDIWLLFQFGETEEDSLVWGKVRNEMEDALMFLTGQVRAFGLAPKLRVRMNPHARLRDFPFFEITFYAQILMRDIQHGNASMVGESYSRFHNLLAECRKQIAAAYQHLDEFGVSVAIVYQLERIEMLIRRIETLLEILLSKNYDPREVVRFLCSLILESQQRRSITSLFAENLSLISMKIAERSAEAGDHYITRTRKEYSSMFWKATGGGALTSFTALFKIFIEALSIPYFIMGFISSMNYALSFLGIYAVGFTLATKQPAMTANALAAKMDRLDNEEARESLIDEIVNLMRSQGAAIFGNLSMVVPFAIGITLAFAYLGSYSLVGEEQAVEIFQKHSILGLSIVHAAFTGVLLWFSSIAAGWVDNWSVYRELPQAISSSRTLKNFLGPTRLKEWVAFYTKHLAGVVGNVSLGFLLGMTPKIFGFLGIPLDVRHVTLSTAVVTYAATQIGIKVFSMLEFWMAFAGIGVIGIMNLGVSFFLALLVALKARRIRAPMRSEIYAMVAERFKQRPTSFFWAPKAAKGESSQ